jgi:L-seryl-tRNA(Ser) seleniumtransferase
MNVYQELGVKKIVNAAFCLTTLGGSILPKETIDAMVDANNCFVEVAELQEKAGEYLAKITGAEAAYVTSGAYSAFVLSAAACMTGTDIEKLKRLPDTTDMKNEILIQGNLRSVFDKAIKVPGAKTVVVGSPERGCTPEEFENAINDKTAAIHYYPLLDPPSEKVLSLKTVTEIAHKHGIPVIVDAAGQTYPLSRLRQFNNQGADLVCFSGKYFQGPNSTGFIAGRKDLVEAAKANGFLGPAEGWFGRGYKLDRQEIVGLVTSVKRWISLDHEKVRFEPARARRSYIKDSLAEVKGIKITSDPYRYHTVGLTLCFDKTPEEVEEMVNQLKSGDPSIWVRRRIEDKILLNTLFLGDGDEKLIVERIKKLI